MNPWQQWKVLRDRPRSLKASDLEYLWAALENLVREARFRGGPLHGIALHVPATLQDWLAVAPQGREFLEESALACARGFAEAQAAEITSVALRIDATVYRIHPIWIPAPLTPTPVPVQASPHSTPLPPLTGGALLIGEPLTQSSGPTYSAHAVYLTDKQTVLAPQAGIPGKDVMEVLQSLCVDVESLPANAGPFWQPETTYEVQGYSVVYCID